MFNGQGVGERGVSKPFIVALILLLLFLTTTQDWGASPGGAGDRLRRAELRGGPGAAEKVKEKIIYDLSVLNEKLERENMQLQQQVLDTRRAFRACVRGEDGAAILENAGWSLEEDPLIFNETAQAQPQDSNAGAEAQEIEPEN
ncbi:unnamed protein product [Ostreobium quekettii]|uniref:Uncharacterized protein n=1 Tax=Ostreobium quekettii TaxID=121088 RepID=A0A8S1IV84_9CHLO|nr:unnamed protein product [Ostreobium quekettii]|eukprot:evm.model.scf_906EXC.3 EVM.evm.TU.scf_906EXC.3   scf_906EXC:27358-30936(+)